MKSSTVGTLNLMLTVICLLLWHVKAGFLSSSPNDALKRLQRIKAAIPALMGHQAARVLGGKQPFEQESLSDLWTKWHSDALKREKEVSSTEVTPTSTKQSEKLSEPPVLVLKTPKQKLRAVRDKVYQQLLKESKQFTSNNQSIITLAVLAFGVLLFDVLGATLFGTSPTVIRTSRDTDRSQDQLKIVSSITKEVIPESVSKRETMLPGYGLFGDFVNNLSEIALNMLTIYLYRDESPDCGERLLCESNQQAVSRGLFDSFVTYISGFAVSFFLHESPLSKNLQAMRAGRKGLSCTEIYPKCGITL